MWSDANPATPADSHSFHTIEETRDHLFAVDAQCREQCGTVVLETTAIRIFPPDRLTTTEPDSETDDVDAMSLNLFSWPGDIVEQFYARTHEGNRLTLVVICSTAGRCRGNGRTR